MKVAVGISGGVDSSVAALLLQRQGHEVVGVTMTLGRADEQITLGDAQKAADYLKIPLKVVNLASAWRDKVLDEIPRSYFNGCTPNPCVSCNAFVKFGLLPRYCFSELGCDRFATGHYARLENARLFRAVDHDKDQSYFLYRVSPDILKRTLFPLGELTKSGVRQLASAEGLECARRPDSQDFCGGDVLEILAHAAAGKSESEGRIVRKDGVMLGTHKGYWNYTVGKRKGLGIGGGTPYYVIGLRPARNEVIVGTREDTIVHTLTLRDTVGEIDFSLPVKVRSAGEPHFLSDGISGVAPGQSAVFYRGEEIVGGGIITLSEQLNDGD